VPFKSKAQRRKFAQLLVEGKIKDETYEEWNRSTGRKELPERIHPKKDEKPKRKRATAKKRSTTTKRSTTRTRAQSKKRSKR
jgi:hypothetical protein